MNHKIVAQVKVVAGMGIFIFLFGQNAWAQEEQNRFPFIKAEHNQLYFSKKDSSAFIRLCARLGSMKEGEAKRINMVHIGGSHVQGGTWSNTFLTGFQERFGTQGGGYFVFPYRIAKTNGQAYAGSYSTGKWKRCRAIGKDFCLPLGMCAMSLSTNDSCNNFGASLTRYASCRRANLVRVYHNFNPSFEFRLSMKEGITAERTDDPEHGCSNFRFSAAVDSVHFEVVKRDTLQKDFVLYGLSLENDEVPGFYLAALGANGAASSSFLRCEHLVPQLASLKADLVILSLGVNDTQSKGFAKEDYIEHYDSLITLVKKACPDAFILLTTTTDNYIRRKTSNKRTVKAQEAMFELMDKHGVGVWDLFTVMGGFKSMSKWNKAGLAARDKVHFTTKGYAIVGNLMLDAFFKSYTTHLKSD